MIAIKDAKTPRVSALDAGGAPMSCPAKKVRFTYTSNGELYKVGRRWNTTWSVAAFDFAVVK